MGTHHYNSLVRNNLKLLEPLHLQQQEEELCREVTQDLQGDVPINDIIDHLQTMLAIKEKGEGYSKLGPVISLMLGMANKRLGKLLEARSHFTNASNNCHTTDWIRREAYFCLGCMYLNYSDVNTDISIAIDEASVENLKLSLSCFEAALPFLGNRIFSTDFFNLSSSKIEIVIPDLKSAITTKKEAAIAIKRQIAESEDIESKKKIDVKNSTIQLPPPSAIVRAPPINTSGGSPLHLAAAKGRLLEVFFEFVDVFESFPLNFYFIIFQDYSQLCIFH
jgi:hypothetical protein